jgi:hypothetical protein
MAALRSKWQMKNISIWLVGGGLCLLLSFIFWVMTDTKQIKEVEKEPETEVEIQIQPEKVAATTHLGALLDEVKPLELTSKLTGSGTHEAEFRGTKFIADNKKNSTIELFRSTDENIVKGFIRKQTDRSNLIYIRLSGEGVNEQYVVLYGNYKNSSDAKTKLASLPMKLPASVKPVVHTFADYEKFVNDLGSDEMGLTGKLHEVKLVPAAVPRVIETQSEDSQAASSATPTTKTTVVRRDQDGNIVDVKRSQTDVSNAPKNNTNSTSE